ncbi:EAL domain-containing protein [Massilia sp. DJPM01]|nr:EAL domain-containing protein [Massilia sp. DJPM01]
MSVHRYAIEASANAMIITRAEPPHFIIEYVNPAFERITGYRAAEVIGRSCNFLQGDDGDQAGIDEIRLALREQRAGNAVLRNYRKDGTLFWNHLFIAPVRGSDGAVSHFVASQYDISQAKQLESELLHLAHHDELTGLPNRALLRDRLLHAIACARRDGSRMWVAFVSLDRFKVINDSFGHGGGDSFLKVIAERLHAVVRGADTVARWRSDEFAILMSDQHEGGLGTAALERIMTAVSVPISYEGQEVVLTCSIGVSGYPDDGPGVDTLLERADIAAFHAKNDGRNCFRFHTADVNQKARARLRIEADLRLALERDEFVLHYQPQIDLGSGRITGVEALVRWQHPSRGLVGPVEFIGIAEETGLIVPIGNWVLRTACLQNRQWQQEGLPHVRVAVNLSARQFVCANLAESVGAILSEIGLAPQDLELELTESLVMRDVERGIGVLRALKHLGVSIAVDDFGTGYSSLAYLKRLPIDVLKIDRSFVMDIGSDDGDAIAASIIGLAHNLKLKVVAEGVESVEQLDYLRVHRCDQVQGYYFSRPVPAPAFAELLCVDGGHIIP